MKLANERAGRFADLAGPWTPADFTLGIEWQKYSREVPNLGWQHIWPQPLHGAGAVIPAAEAVSA